MEILILRNNSAGLKM